MVNGCCTPNDTLTTVAVPASQGTTAMLLVNIPHFRELLIASFECPECGFRCDTESNVTTDAIPRGDFMGDGVSVASHAPQPAAQGC